MDNQTTSLILLEQFALCESISSSAYSSEAVSQCLTLHISHVLVKAPLGHRLVLLIPRRLGLPTPTIFTPTS